MALFTRFGGLSLGLMLLIVLAGGPVGAQETSNEAGLVVIDGEGGVGYAVVTFDEPEISGMELLRRSGAEPVTVSFGGLGEGVCGIGRTGCAVDVCRKRVCQTGSPDSPYWQTFAAGDGSTWEPLQLGASADRVRDGDVRLWAWTESPPAVATVTLDDISRRVGTSRNRILWDGGRPVDDTPGTPIWFGVGLVAVAGVAAVAMRARSQAG